MFADPVTAKANTADQSFARTTLGNSSAVYTYGDYTVVTKQNKTKDRFRREIRFTHTKVAADPISTLNKSIGTSVYAVIDEPSFGYTDAELLVIIGDLADFLTRSTKANSAKLLAGEY